jgi:hypothetical protein
MLEWSGGFDCGVEVWDLVDDGSVMATVEGSSTGGPPYACWWLGHGGRFGQVHWAETLDDAKAEAYAAVYRCTR